MPNIKTNNVMSKLLKLLNIPLGDGQRKDNLKFINRTFGDSIKSLIKEENKNGTYGGAEGLAQFLSQNDELTSKIRKTYETNEQPNKIPIFTKDGDIKKDKRIVKSMLPGAGLPGKPLKKLTGLDPDEIKQEVLKLATEYGPYAFVIAAILFPEFSGIYEIAGAGAKIPQSLQTFENLINFLSGAGLIGSVSEELTNPTNKALSRILRDLSRKFPDAVVRENPDKPGEITIGRGERKERKERKDGKLVDVPTPATPDDPIGIEDLKDGDIDVLEDLLRFMRPGDSFSGYLRANGINISDELRDFLYQEFGSSFDNFQLSKSILKKIEKFVKDAGRDISGLNIDGPPDVKETKERKAIRVRDEDELAALISVRGEPGESFDDVVNRLNIDMGNDEKNILENFRRKLGVAKVEDIYKLADIANKVDKRLFKFGKPKKKFREDPQSFGDESPEQELQRKQTKEEKDVGVSRKAQQVISRATILERQTRELQKIRNILSQDPNRPISKILKDLDVKNNNYLRIALDRLRDVIAPDLNLRDFINNPIRDPLLIDELDNTIDDYQQKINRFRKLGDETLSRFVFNLAETGATVNQIFDAVSSKNPGSAEIKTPSGDVIVPAEELTGRPGELPEELPVVDETIPLQDLPASPTLRDAWDIISGQPGLRDVVIDRIIPSRSTLNKIVKLLLLSGTTYGVIDQTLTAIKEKKGPGYFLKNKEKKDKKRYLILPDGSVVDLKHNELTGEKVDPDTYIVLDKFGKPTNRKYSEKKDKFVDVKTKKMDNKFKLPGNESAQVRGTDGSTSTESKNVKTEDKFVDSNTGEILDVNTGEPTGEIIDLNTNKIVNEETGEETGEVFNEETGEIEPEDTKNTFIDAKTGELIDARTGETTDRIVDPDTLRIIDTETGRPTGEVFNENTGEIEKDPEVIEIKDPDAIHRAMNTSKTLDQQEREKVAKERFIDEFVKSNAREIRKKDFKTEKVKIGLLRPEFKLGKAEDIQETDAESKSDQENWMLFDFHRADNEGPEGGDASVNPLQRGNEINEHINSQFSGFHRLYDSGPWNPLGWVGYSQENVDEYGTMGLPNVAMIKRSRSDQNRRISLQKNYSPNVQMFGKTPYIENNPTILKQNMRNLQIPADYAGHNPYEELSNIVPYSETNLMWSKKNVLYSQVP